MSDSTEQDPVRQTPSLRDWWPGLAIAMTVIGGVAVVSQWQGRVDTRLSTIQDRLTSIDQAVSPVAEKLYQAAFRQQQTEQRLEAAERRVAELERRQVERDRADR